MNELPNKGKVVPPKMGDNLNTVSTTIKPPIMPPPQPSKKGKDKKKYNLFNIMDIFTINFI